MSDVIHPEIPELRQLASGQVEPTRAAEIRAHMTDCIECRQDHYIEAMAELVPSNHRSPDALASVLAETC